MFLHLIWKILNKFWLILKIISIDESKLQTSRLNFYHNRLPCSYPRTSGIKCKSFKTSGTRTRSGYTDTLRGHGHAQGMFFYGYSLQIMTTNIFFRKLHSSVRVGMKKLLPFKPFSASFFVKLSIATYDCIPLQMVLRQNDFNKITSNIDEITRYMK